MYLHLVILQSGRGHKSPVDRATAQEFKAEPMPEAAQIHVIGAVGDILRHLNLLAFLADVSMDQAGIAVQSFSN